MINKTRTYLLSILILLIANNVIANDSPMTLKAAYLLGHSIEGMVVNQYINENNATDITWTIATIEASNLEFMGYTCASEIRHYKQQFCKATILLLFQSSNGQSNSKICSLRGELSKESMNFRCGSGWRW